MALQRKAMAEAVRAVEDVGGAEARAVGCTAGAGAYPRVQAEMTAARSEGSWKKTEEVAGEAGSGNVEEIRVRGEVGVGHGGDFPQRDGRDGGGGGQRSTVEAAEGRGRGRS